MTWDVVSDLLSGGQRQTYDFGEILGFAVALGDSGVPVPEHGSDRTANNIAPTENDGAQTLDRDSG